MEQYTAAKVIVKHPSEDSILLIKRKKGEKIGYEVPGGRVDINFTCKEAETLEECAKREMKEELNLNVNSLEYIGSYYFFWTIKENVCSICTVFTGNVENIENLTFVGDESGVPIYAEWIKIEDILQSNILIEPQHVGLLKVLQKACLNFLNEKSECL